MACRVKIGLGDFRVQYLHSISGLSCPWTFKKEKLYVKGYGERNLELIRKSKILRKKEPTH